jgi:adenine-specific DNA-methyltransferase
MGSLVKKYSQKKLLGQVYTPEHIVDKILDSIDFLGVNILGKSILDPSCGDGQFLIRIVARILEVAPIDDLPHFLSFVHGWDIDPDAVSQCKSNLDELVAPYGLQIDWNISTCNALLHGLQARRGVLATRFDFIVGNPPYIRIQHLDDYTRDLVQHNYDFCKKGSTDIYIAFFEICLYLLTEPGTAGMITPNTFLFTETAESLRQYLRHNSCIKRITNYGTIQLFENATTYSAITIFGLESHSEFIYEDAITPFDSLSKRCSAASLPLSGGWKLSASKEIESSGTTLKDISTIHVGLTTLCDKAYFFSVEPYNDRYVIAHTRLLGKLKIESGILRPIIKVSKYKSAEQPISEYALFPYKDVNGENKIINESEFKQDFPLAYNYLLKIKDVLDSRDNGKRNSVAWYAYGRSQGINLPKGKKILFSPMNQYPNFVLSEHRNALFYSGYCILTECHLDSLLMQLNTDKMYDYISVASRDFRGGWKAYNKTVLQDFPINRLCL